MFKIINKQIYFKTNYDLRYALSPKNVHDDLRIYKMSVFFL